MKLRLGVGEAVIGIDRKGNDSNPSITFRKLNVRGKVGRDVTNDCISPPDFSLEIVGLEGLVVLEKIIKRAKDNLQKEEDFLQLLVRIEHILEL